MTEEERLRETETLFAQRDSLRAEVERFKAERDELLAALVTARELGMSIEPMQGDGLVWAMKNERAQHAEAEADAYRARVGLEERARADVEAALRSTTTRAEKAEHRAIAAEARAERLAEALRAVGVEINHAMSTVSMSKLNEYLTKAQEIRHAALSPPPEKKP